MKVYVDVMGLLGCLNSVWENETHKCFLCRFTGKCSDSFAHMYPDMLLAGMNESVHSFNFKIPILFFVRAPTNTISCGEIKIIAVELAGHLSTLSC